MKKYTIVFLIITMLMLAGCGLGNGQTSAEEESMANEYITALKEKVDPEISCFGETVTDISINKKTVTFNVDISAVDASALNTDDIAEAVFFRVTEAALEVTDYDDLWDSMKVDFGEAGSITKTKDDIKGEGSGRHFEYEAETSWD